MHGNGVSVISEFSINSNFVIMIYFSPVVIFKQPYLLLLDVCTKITFNKL